MIVFCSPSLLDSFISNLSQPYYILKVMIVILFTGGIHQIMTTHSCTKLYCPQNEIQKDLCSSAHMASS